MSAWDAIIVGAGPAGMAAAIRMRGLGLTVLVADEQPTPGGQVWRGVERNNGTRLGDALGKDYIRGEALVRAFRECGAEYRPETHVWQVEDGWRVFMTHDGKAEHHDARAILIATGAQERAVPFSGWTLPGVMTVGAAQILLKSGGYLPSGPVWMCGAGPLPLLYAHQMLILGARLEGFLDTAPSALRPKTARHLPAALRDWRSLAKGAGWRRELRKAGLRWIGGVRDLRADGTDRVERISWTAGGKSESAEAGLILVHEGVVPSIHITLGLGCAHDWSGAQGCLVPRLNEWNETSKPGLFVAGDGAGIGGVDAAVARGDISGLAIANRLNFIQDADRVRRDDGMDRRLAQALASRPFLDAHFPPPDPELDDDVIVCRCENVTAGRIREAARTGAPDPNQVKAATRAGMGPCQGRQCGYPVSRLIAEVHDLKPEEVGFFNIRPPFKPVTIGELASMNPAEAAE